MVGRVLKHWVKPHVCPFSLEHPVHGAATTDGDVYVSIIPFVKDVNLGKSNFAADWIYWGTVTGPSAQDPTMADDDSWDANNGTCSSGGWSKRPLCRANVGTCSVSGYTNQDSCTSSGMCKRGLQFREHLHEPRHLFKSIIYKEKQLPESWRHVDRKHLDVL